MQPLLVASTTVGKLAARKAARETAECIEIRIVVQSGALQSESVAMHPIVGVHPRHDRGRAERNARIESRYQTLVGSSFESKTRIT
jgi:hypothetical protein